ncbi:MAG: hypothetical protein RMI94_08975 [Bryobacterales bacterium]|nr:hypothetical protein [Bryobacteraceae bacterium]MDW8130670.1 hypothetical protein [Bryobacterales bacterium]
MCPLGGAIPSPDRLGGRGVITSGSWRYLRSFDIGGTSGFSINGERQKANEAQLDGISNVRAGHTVLSVPTSASLYGFKGPSESLRGPVREHGRRLDQDRHHEVADEFHGTLFECFRNDKLNGTQAELNQPRTIGGVPYPRGIKPADHIKQFVAMHSGPYDMPKLVDTRHRAFIMLSPENTR